MYGNLEGLSKTVEQLEEAQAFLKTPEGQARLRHAAEVRERLAQAGIDSKQVQSFGKQLEALNPTMNARRLRGIAGALAAPRSRATPSFTQPMLAPTTQSTTNDFVKVLRELHVEFSI